MSDCRWTILDNGRLYCPVCDPDKKRTQRRDTGRWCGPPPDSPAFEPPPPQQPVDAAQWFTAYYRKQNYPMLPLSAILSKLERCRSADCDKLQDDVCTMLGSNACKQRSNWFRMLAGGTVCQNWLPQQPPPERKSS